MDQRTIENRHYAYSSASREQIEEFGFLHRTSAVRRCCFDTFSFCLRVGLHYNFYYRTGAGNVTHSTNRTPALGEKLLEYMARGPKRWSYRFITGILHYICYPEAAFRMDYPTGNVLLWISLHNNNMYQARTYPVFR